ncbi:MAG: glycosyltransferase family 4 protein [Candidatus Eiseniibacteriota bacterium]
MSGKVRVLHVITRLIRGGADENTVFTVEGVDPDRYESSLVAGAGSEVEGFAEEIRRRTQVLPELVRDPHPFRDVVALFKLWRLMRRGRYHIVHTHTAKAGFLGRIAARMAGVPCVVHTLHGVTFPDHVHPLARHLYVLLERIAARCCDVLITVGDDVRARYLEASIGRREQYVTIPSGMDTRAFEDARAGARSVRVPVREELGLEDRHVVVGMVSRLEPRKGWTYFLESVARLAPDFPDLRALVVGEGGERERLQRAAHDLGIGERVVFAGYRSDVARVIAAFDVAVLTSLWEGLPRVLVQYALLERPVVTFAVEGSREVVEDGVSGWVVPLRDTEALVERLRPLVASAELRSTVGARARRRVEGRWDVEVMVDGIERVYETVSAGR